MGLQRFGMWVHRLRFRVLSFGFVVWVWGVRHRVEFGRCPENNMRSSLRHRVTALHSWPCYGTQIVCKDFPAPPNPQNKPRETQPRNTMPAKHGTLNENPTAPKPKPRKKHNTPQSKTLQPNTYLKHRKHKIHQQPISMETIRNLYL